MPAARRAGEAVAALLAEFFDVEEVGRPDDETLHAGVARLIGADEAEFFYAARWIAEPPPWEDADSPV